MAEGAEAPVRPVTLEEEFLRNAELREEDVALLRDWAQKQPHLPPVQDRELALFLHSCYYRAEAAKVALDTYFTARSHISEFFAQRDPHRPEVQQAAQLACMVKLPRATAEGHAVLFCRLVDGEPSHFVHADCVKVFFMVAELLLLQDGCAPGHAIVMDMQGIALGHVARLSLPVYKKFFYFLQEGLPFRLKGLHFINVVPFMDKILAMMRPFMNKEIQEMLHLYTSDNIEQLYKFVPKEILPEDYGGTAPSHLKLHARTLARLQANAAYFAAEEQRRVAEERRPARPGDPAQGFGLQGSFKKLDID